jgi:uncharacterized protein (DUF433 family)
VPCYANYVTIKAMSKVIHSDPEVLSGMPVFIGTRVPMKNLFDYLEAGDSIEDFLDDFPSVSPEQVQTFLRELQDQTVKDRKTAGRSCWMSAYLEN